MRVLILNPDVPFPPICGGQSRTYHLLRALAAHHDLTLVVFKRGLEDGPATPPFPLEVISVPWVRPELYRQMHEGSPLESDAAYRQLAYENDEPWFVSCYDSPTMEDVLKQMARRSFDLILIEHSFMGKFLPFLHPDVPKILNLHNVHTLMAWRSALEKSGSDRTDAEREFERTRSFERMVSKTCQLCLCCSEDDAEAARRFLNIERVRVIPNGVDTVYMRPNGSAVVPGYILFTGTMDYEPNVEAVRYFAGYILPLIRRQVPHATFHIAGAYPRPEVQALASEGSVFIHGSVADMRPHFHAASVVVVPLLHGGGTRLKILDAAACGKPIVSTPLGAEGLKFVDGRDLILADSASAFAHAVAGLLSDPRRRSELSQAARRAAGAYDWTRIGREFRHAVIGVARTHRNRRRRNNAVTPRFPPSQWAPINEDTAVHSGSDRVVPRPARQEG